MPNWPVKIKSGGHGWVSDDQLATYNASREEGFLCDATLRSRDGLVFPVHKLICAAASDRFERLFESPTGKEEGEETVDVEADGAVLSRMLDWIYAAQFEADDSVTLLKMTSLAGKLEMPELRAECSLAFKKALSDDDDDATDNLFDCWDYVENNDVGPDLDECCRRFASCNFYQLSRQPRFFDRIDSRRLARLLQSDDLDVPEEDFVWTALKAWAETKDASSSLDGLLRYVRPGLLRKRTLGDVKSYLEKQVRSGFSRCHSWIVEAERRVEDVSLAREFAVRLLEPRLPRQLVFVQLAQSGSGEAKSSLCCYDVRADLWRVVERAQLPSNSVALCQPVLNKTEIVFLAQEPFKTPRVLAMDANTFSTRELSTLNMAPTATGCPAVISHRDRLTACFPNGCIEVYDEKENAWFAKRLIAASAIRDEFMIGASFASLDGKLYVIGGMNHEMTETTANVRCYDEANEMLDVKGRMAQGRVYPGCCVHNGKILIAGGFSQPFSGSLLSVEEFDPIARTVVSLADLQMYTNDNCLLAVDRTLLAIEGHKISDHGMATWTSKKKGLQLYDAEAGRWEWRRAFRDESGNKLRVLGMTVVNSFDLDDPYLYLPDARWRGTFAKLPAMSTDADEEQRVGPFEERVEIENIF